MPLTENALKTIHELKICAKLTKSFLKEFVAIVLYFNFYCLFSSLSLKVVNLFMLLGNFTEIGFNGQFMK
jgi:hypothetical protein